MSSCVLSEPSPASAARNSRNSTRNIAAERASRGIRALTTAFNQPVSNPESRSQDLGDLLRDYRRAMGLTQEELAERASVSPRSISELERGGAHVPRRDTLALLAAALGLDRADREALEALATERRKRSRLESHADRCSASDCQQHGHNIPRSLTRFIGRSEDLEQLGATLLTRPLVTLVGPGGVGKTRLAEEWVRANFSLFEDGCWLVELADLFDAALVPVAIARTIGFREVRTENMRTALVDHIGQKHMLLILDNCEHLIEICAEIVDELLRSCPRLHILVTSREALSIAGETRWQVLPFDVPATPAADALDELRDNPAVQLFLDRASSVAEIQLTADTAQAIGRICASVSGIPLALELAAASTRMLTLDEVADRLGCDVGLLSTRNRVAPARHRTLRATIDWSHDLLSGAEQILLRRLSLFASGWKLEAAEEICVGDGIQQSQVLALLAGLLDKSLVVADARGTVARYRLLEPVRQYAIERLHASGETTQFEERHATYFLTLARGGPHTAVGVEEIAALERFELEHANLRTALYWALNNNQTEAALVAASGLFRFWERRGHANEGCTWLEHALARDDVADIPDEVRCGALNALAFLYWRSGAADRAEPAAQEALAIGRAATYERGMAAALINLGMSAFLQHEYQCAEVCLEQGVEHARQINRPPMLGVALSFLGRVLLTAHEDGEDRAATVIQEALSVARAAQSRYTTGHALATWGDLLWARHDVPGAVEAWHGALIVFSDLTDRRGVAGCLERLALAIAHYCRIESAAWLFGAADAQHAVLGMQLRQGEHVDHAHFAQYQDQETAREAYPFAWSAGREASIHDAVARAVEYTQGLDSR